MWLTAVLKCLPERHSVVSTTKPPAYPQESFTGFPLLPTKCSWDCTAKLRLRMHRAYAAAATLSTLRSRCCCWTMHCINVYWHSAPSTTRIIRLRYENFFLMPTVINCGTCKKSPNLACGRDCERQRLQVWLSWFTHRPYGPTAIDPCLCHTLPTLTVVHPNPSP